MNNKSSKFYKTFTPLTNFIYSYIKILKNFTYVTYKNTYKFINLRCDCSTYKIVVDQSRRKKTNKMVLWNFVFIILAVKYHSDKTHMVLHNLDWNIRESAIFRIKLVE